MATGFGMPFGFAELLDRKYRQQQQQIDTTRFATEATANLERVRAALMPEESAAQIAETRANTINLGLTGQTILPMMRSTIGLQGAQAGNYGAEAGLRRAQTGSEILASRPRRNIGFGFGSGTLPDPYATPRFSYGGGF